MDRGGEGPRLIRQYREVPQTVGSTPGPLDPIAQGKIRVICHGRLCLKLIGRLSELQNLLDNHSFWATGRRRKDLLRMVLGSTQVVTAWEDQKLIGFGRATSDGVFRSVLWDVVIAQPYQGLGIGRQLVMALISCKTVGGVERVYLMTTNSSSFYEKLGFHKAISQALLVKTK